MPDPVLERLRSVLGDTHTIERELGGGGMARVFVATERALGRQVVIKTLPDDDWTSGSIERFRREILTAAQLQHANVVPVLSAGDADGMPYFVMPLIDGASLRERMARGPVPLREAIGILRDVARALGAAHARGVVHRDIKPANILLSAGAALVTDFGVAKAVSAATAAGEAAPTLTGVGVSVGTPAYMAPEQVAADPAVDHRADLYAWGVVAYELLAGRRPYGDLSGAALVTAQMTTPPEPLDAVAPAVPRPLAALVARCLQADPSARPQRSDALLAVLDQPSGEGVAPAAGGGRRRSFAVAAIAVLAIAAAWWQFGRGGDAPSADTATIAVAPFRVGGAAADARYLREGLGDIIVAQLQTLPSTGAAGMRVMLDRWRRAGGGEDRDLDDAAASRAALDAGAGRLILGEIVGTGAALTVNARLLDAEQGGELARARVQGSADSLVVLASRIVTTLLSLDEGASSERLQAVLSARSEALTPFLTGEQLYRRGRYGEAGDAYVAAYEADTTFALAALRVYLANGWRIDSTVPGDWLDRAWRHRSRLSGTDSLLLIANAGETYPEPMPVRAALAAGERLARASNSAEIWYTYADDLFHIGLQVDEPNTLERALEGFTRAEALDSSFVPALEHQSQLYLALGDTANARRAHARQAAKDSLGDFFLVNDLMMSLTLGDDADRERAVSRAAARRPAILLYQAMLSTLRVAPGAALRIAVGDSAVARFERVDRGAVLPLSDRLRREFFWNRGQPAEAAARPAAPGQVSSDVEIVFAGLLWDADSAQARRAAERLQAYVDGRPADDYDSFYASAHFALAERAFARGDTAEVEARQAAIRRAGRAAPEPWLSETHAVYDEALGAQLAQARGAPDARERFERLDSLLVHAPNLSRRVARTTGNIVLAELWERAGEPERALRVARRQDWQFGFAMYYPDRLRRIARLARRLDRPEEEAEALQHFVEMRAQAEPHLQPEVAEARARLAVLRGGDR